MLDLPSTQPLSKPASQRGNAMIYVLIALALFGALTLTLSSQNEQADGEEISDEQAELYAVELIEYAASAKNVVDQMIMTGTSINELDFVNPSSAGFDTPPHIHKVYHPSGGGLNYQAGFNENIIDGFSAGWYVMSETNVEWTPTTADDVILSALRVSEKVCATINKKITGSLDIPQTAIGLNNLFDPNNVAKGDFLNTSCTTDACIGYPSLCVQNITDLDYGFFNIVAAR